MSLSRRRFLGLLAAAPVVAKLERLPGPGPAARRAPPCLFLRPEGLRMYVTQLTVDGKEIPGDYPIEVDPFRPIYLVSASAGAPIDYTIEYEDAEEEA